VTDDQWVSAARASAHAQKEYGVRLDWGATGGAAVASDTDFAVVVDVLSFTTTLSIAVGRGTRVHPFPWKDERAAAFASERHAVLAVGRFEARSLDVPTPSLSPAQLLAAPAVPRLVLPSPNGSTICAALDGPRVVGASLRNRSAVADWLRPRLAEGATIALVPAGERWPDGTLRPAVEDLWGAGAVLAALGPAALAGRGSSIEAEHAAAAYSVIEGRLSDALHRCSSGRELAAVGFAEDVAAAADLDADDVVPVLGSDGFAAA
jgi:2-phosphosulfolactate phosphatase